MISAHHNFRSEPMVLTFQNHHNFVAETMGSTAQKRRKLNSDLMYTQTQKPRDFVSDTASTTQKHRKFVSEPMGNKPVTDVAGIGPVYGKRLADQGYDKAYVLLEKFLMLKKNEELFVDWLKSTCNANKRYAGMCYNCFSDWCNAFL